MNGITQEPHLCLSNEIGVMFNMKVLLCLQAMKIYLMDIITIQVKELQIKIIILLNSSTKQRLMHRR